MRKLIDLPKDNDHSKQNTPELGGVGTSKKHESAKLHVSGAAIYIDDRPEVQGQLHAAVGKSSFAHAIITSIDLSEVNAAEGVIAVITVNDVPGQIDIGPVFKGDPVLAPIDGKGAVQYVGQPIFAVAATSHQLAKKAVLLAKINYQELTPTLTIKDALARQNFVRPSYTMQRGDADKAIKNASHQLMGKISIGGQEHFYLEGQVSSVEPTEEDGMIVYSSSQHPSEVQKLVAEVLALPLNKITVDTRRMGGGFGGKETNAAPWACIAALLVNVTNKPVKLRLSRTDDMEMTGKRHPFENDYHIGFNDHGLINAVNITVNGNCGYSPDLSDAIVDRAMFHSDNAYYLNNMMVTGNRCKTNTVSHTAFRGFGGPQGMMTIEMAMDDIARSLGKDPLAIRKLNLYAAVEPDNASRNNRKVKNGNKRNITHYHQTVEHNNLPEIIDTLEKSSDYQQRRQQITQFNKTNPILKKGIALTPVKFGISFTVQHLNQAGALVHIYTDGTIHLNHGGTEMGQGLFTKVAQIVAEEFKVNVDTVGVSATRTDKVPNTSPTAASSGTDLNGKAAQNAAKTIKQRLINFAVEHFSITTEQIIFANSQVQLGDNCLSFAEFVQLAYMNRISLSATGFYKTPKIHFDRATAKGRPFFYFAHGAAVSEVIIDTLTGEYKLLRTDILQDVGTSLNPAIDKGQIEGGFVQGVGWLTTEELLWNEKGRLLSNNPATYKIPAITDIPVDFRIELLKDDPNREQTIYNSKAVGEPPLMLAISVWSALRDAISSVSNYSISPQLDTPTTPERILFSVMATQDKSQALAKNKDNGSIK